MLHSVNKKSISVVIPNYNGRCFLENAIPNLYKALIEADTEHEIILSDDCSTDDTLSFIRHNYPEIIITENKKNNGFAITANAGIRMATKDLVFLMNTDVDVSEDYFLNQFRYFDNHITFGVMGKIVSPDKETITDSAKYPQYRFTNINSTVNYLIQDKTPRDFLIPSFFLSGANALYCREKLQMLGGFDELLSPYYSEDSELSFRAWRLGFKCYFDNESVCTHPISATISKYNTRKKIKRIAKRNRMFVHFIHLRGIEFLVWFVLLTFKTIIHIPVLQFWYVQAYILFLAKIKKAYKSKNRFYKLQKKMNVSFSMKDVRSIIKSQISNYSIIKY